MPPPGHPRLSPRVQPPPPRLLQVLIKKQQELKQRPAAAQQLKQQQQRRGLMARLKLQPAGQSVAASRPQGSPAACLSLALPVPGWQEQQ